MVLCRVWKFPTCFWSVSGFHHRPLEAPDEHRILTTLVHAADILVARAKIGYTRTVETDTVADALLDTVQITREQLQETQEELPDAVEEAASMLRG